VGDDAMRKALKFCVALPNVLLKACNTVMSKF